MSFSTMSCALLEHEHSNTRNGGWDRVKWRRRCGRLTHEVIVIVRSMLCVEWNIYNCKLIYTDGSLKKKTRRIYLALKKYKLYLEILKGYKRDIQRRKKMIERENCLDREIYEDTEEKKKEGGSLG